MATATRTRRRKPPLVVDREAPDFALEAVVDGMREEHIQCRDFSHSWRPFTASVVRYGNRGSAYEQQLRCSRCRSIRRRLLSMTGSVITSNYDYSDGYIIKGLGRLTGTEKDHLRLVSVQRLVVEDTAEA